jgi:hypothetical protein
MKFREVTLADGQMFQVPQGIQRIDSKSTHGWQVRYQGTKLFSDGKSGDAKRSLSLAIRELLSRITATPGALTLKQDPSANKSSDLPSGISGPIVRERPGRAPVAELSVLLPRFGGKAQTKNVYIGSQNTYSVDKYHAALAKCMDMRSRAASLYEKDAAKAQQVALTALRAQLRSLRA